MSLRDGSTLLATEAAIFQPPAMETFGERLVRLSVPPQTDPIEWAGTNLPDRFLWSKQGEILESIRDNRRTAVRSCHGVGKSYIAATVAAWWASAFPPGEALVVSTAPTAAQVSAILWEEIRKAHSEGGLRGKIGLDNVWRLANGGMVGLGRKPSDHNEHSFQGLHRRRVLVIADEACGIAKQLWTAFEAVATGEDCKLLAIGNPDDPASEFATMCRPGSGWNVIGISAFDSPNLTGEVVPHHVARLLVSADWVNEKKRMWGESSPRYQSKVLGLFPEIGTDTLIAPSWIEDAINAEFPEENGPKGKIGIDVARFGSDDSILSHMALNGRFRIHTTLPMSETTQVSGQAIALARDLGWPDISIDGIGVGAGVVDELREKKREQVIPQSVTIRDFQAAGASTDPDFGNARAQAYWSLRERFQERGVDLDPADEELAAQLGSIKYRYDARGRIWIESKDEMTKRGLPSPDRADAMMISSTRLGATAPKQSGQSFTRNLAGGRRR